jgi:hypothetical protein
VIYSYGIYPAGSPLTSWRRYEDKVADRRRALTAELTVELMPLVQHGLINRQELRAIRKVKVARRLETYKRELGLLIAEVSNLDNQTATAETQNKKEKDSE